MKRVRLHYENDSKGEKTNVSTGTIIDSAEVMLKKSIFTFWKKTLKQNKRLLLVQNLHFRIAFYLW